MKIKVLRMIAVLLSIGIFTTMYTSVSKVSAAKSEVDINNGIIGTAYNEYIDIHKGAVYPNAEVKILGKDYTNSDMNPELKKDFNGSQECVTTSEAGFIEWKFDVPQTGLYNIEIKYYSLPGKGGSIERELQIDGNLPFNEARFLTFSRVWQDKDENFRTDSAGNDIRPTQVERFEWLTTTVTDPFGYISDPLGFYFDSGSHTLRLQSIREPMAIEYIKLYKAEEPLEYASVLKQQKSLSTENGKDNIYIVAEKAFEKSDFSIYPYNDSSSAATEPQDTTKLKLNALGGNKWQTSGQWISWKFTVGTPGYYWIVPRSRQNVYDGVYVSRKLIIDGKVPFKEAKQISFNYNSDWQLKPLGDGKTDFSFYFDEGDHEIELQVVLGNFANLLGQVDSSIYELNSIYRSVLMITGATPDVYRDYGFASLIPDTIKSIQKQAIILQNVSKILEKNTGQKGEDVVLIDKVVFQLENMYKNPDTIAQQFNSFKSNIGALGTWVLTARQQPLELDYFKIVPVGSSLPKAEGSFIEKIVFSIKSFISSFFVDYNMIGKIKGDTNQKTVNVWLPTGRDQAQIIKALSDDSFTPKTKINVNLKLVAAGTLLPSILAGIGPDVALSNPNTDPINFATRKAVIDLSKMDGFNTIIKRFIPESMVPYQFNGGTYALPETLQFPMMFYRKDIFKELNLSPPTTWDEFYKLIPELQKRSMEIGYPSSLSGLQIFLYQMGGELYNKELTESSIDSNMTLDAFKKYTELFTVYKFPVAYDFANRFRTGEMPLGITDYTMYNQLTVFAPEIRGLWDFVPLPSSTRADGTVCNASPATSTGGTSCTGVIMPKGTKDIDTSWKFIDWWTSDDTQSRFCTEMEAVIGVAAKQPTANIEVLKKLPWSASEYQNLSKQFKNIVGTPEVPGGYYIARNVDFAFNNVYNFGYNPINELLSYTKTVNAEITRKRTEFGLK